MAYEDNALDIGRVMRCTGAVVGARPAAIFGIAAVSMAVPAAISYALGEPGRDAAARGMGLAGGMTMLGLIANAAMQAALFRITIDEAAGVRRGMSEIVPGALRALPAMIGLTILSWLGIFGASLLLVVPGIIVALMWAVAGPALIARQEGVLAALGYSRAITRGARGSLFLLLSGIGIVVSIIAIGAFMAKPDLATPGGVTVGILVIQVAINAVVYALWSVLTAAIYVDLSAGDGELASERYAEVFA
ncbi:hypothetical protein [Sphingomonas fennica]|uniref:Glycerophosphoryl diester phosphodiesterase membrane domain-containing protein n=1 Tax=Edaphosphingomonas fennica TaxID=114404 RepID=A0A2T4I4A6_9SPHN|nr:hypothetical protein [Sphingomonas fennica]PTD24240.1 hypothetical protein CV103_08420 [Sphingomonas fennica]